MVFTIPNGDNEIRTRDPLLARQVLSQLSYTPKSLFLSIANILFLPEYRINHKTMGLSGLEPPTSRLSGVRSNRLSYKPFFFSSGSHLLSHTVSCAVPSADSGLTFVFGMDTGVPHSRITTRFFLLLASLASPLVPLKTQQLDRPYSLSLRKEVIQPHLPIRLPCYDFTPVIGSTFGSSFLSVRSLTSGISNSHGVTGGVYKTRERIHRSILICDY